MLPRKEGRGSVGVGPVDVTKGKEDTDPPRDSERTIQSHKRESVGFGDKLRTNG